MSIKAYKGFNKNMTCKGFQFKEGETYHEDEAKMCEKGFHACLNPLDCLSYYSLTDSVYHEVELDEVTEEKSEDTKICGKTIKIGAALDIAGIVKASIDFVFKSIKDCFNKTKNNDSGNNAQIGSSGYNANIGSSGDCAQIGSSGNNAKIGSSGNNAKIDMQGQRSVAMCAGDNGKIRGKIGDWITLAEWDKDKDDNYYPKYVKTAKITGKAIKPDTWYTLKDGKFVEVSDDEEKG